MTLQDTIVDYAKKWYGEWKDILPSQIEADYNEGILDRHYDDGYAIDYIYEGVENREPDFYEYMLGYMSDAELVDIITAFYNEGLYNKISTFSKKADYRDLYEFASILCSEVAKAFNLTDRIADELGLED